MTRSPIDLAMRAPVIIPQPWYRQRWPWLLLAGPALVVVASLVTAFIAASTDDGVIADDYYKRGLMINKELERTARADALKVGAVLHVAPDGAVSLVLNGAPQAATPTVRLMLVHPTRAGRDHLLTLTRGADGVYAGKLPAPVDGRWHVTVETDAWRLSVPMTYGSLDEVRLGTARAVD